MWRSPSQIFDDGRAGACVRRASSAILEDVSRRRHDHAPATAVTTNEDFSDEELDFFRRGDELHPPATDPAETPDGDA
jgi:hypothetical protein